MKEKIRRIFDSSARLQKEFLKENLDSIVTVAEVLTDVLKKGRKVLFFGNGGSAADAQHLAAEFVNRFRAERRALPGLALTTDSSVLTSIGNDSGFDRIFSRQIEALGKTGDAAVGLSTSSTSPNVVEAFRIAGRQGLITIALAGGDGGVLLRETDYCLLVPSTSTPRVQEIHILVGHVLCSLVESAFVERHR